MDDLEFRRRLLSDPNDNSSDILSDIHTNQHSKKYADSLLDLNEQLEQALRVDVPDDLADKIIFNHSPNKPQINLSRQMFALAASVIFTFGLIIGQVNWGNVVVQPAHASLDRMALHHIKEEEPFLEGINEANAEQEMRSKLGVYSYHLTNDFPYHIFYLNHCGFSDEHHALHMIFQGKKGRVTAFISNIKAPKKQQFTQSDMHGEITPLTQGSLILVGETGEDIKALSERIAPMFQFSS